MDDLTQKLGNRPLDLSGLLQHVLAGNHDAVPDAEAHAAYSQVTGQLSPQEFQQVAAKAYEQLSPEQRVQLVDHLRTQAQQQGIDMPNVSANRATADPGAAADATAQVHAAGPNLLQQLFAPGGTFSNPIAKMALLGITAFAAQRLSGRR
jgi:hypothetical protein